MTLPERVSTELGSVTRIARIRALGVVPVEVDLLRTGRRLPHDARKLGKALISVIARQG